MLKRLCALGALLLLTACGGGGSDSGSNGSTTVSTPGLSNFTTITVDGGPAALNAGPNGYTQDNVGYVTVTLCAPGTSTCQTIDHVQLDTGSVGLRIAQSALSASLLAALPNQTDQTGAPVGECFGYVDGYVFGSVRQADFQIGGEKVANMPLQVVGDGGAFANVPASCSAGGGSNLNTVPLLGANGVLGIGVTTTDCGSLCATAGGFSAAIYYDCPASGCATIIARTPATSAPFQQLPNPVAAMSVDNNGSVITFPSVTSTGQSTVSGTLYFGIGTQTNNALQSATVIPTTTSTSNRGAGLVNVVYKGQSLNDSYIDSGTSLLLFSDSAIAQCSTTTYSGYYCPTSQLSLSITVSGTSGLGAQAALPLNNAMTLLTSPNAVLPGLGADPGLFSDSFPNSFALGLPFFYGRTVYTAIEGRNAGGTLGPYFAF